MTHKKHEFETHAKVLMFATIIGAEIGLAWLAGEKLIWNIVAVVSTSYLLYILDDMYDFLFKRKRNE